MHFAVGFPGVAGGGGTERVCAGARCVAAGGTALSLRGGGAALAAGAGAPALATPPWCEHAP